MRKREAVLLLTGIAAAMWGSFTTGQDEFPDEENRFQDTEQGISQNLTIETSWPTGFCGNIGVKNPVDPAAIWNASLEIHGSTFKIIGDVWGASTSLDSRPTDTGSSNVLIPEEDEAVKMVDEAVVLNLCMGVDTDFVVSGLNLSHYLPNLGLELVVDFTYDALEIRKLGVIIPNRYICSLEQCSPPNCFCAQETPPVGPDGTVFNPRKVPQFVVVTIDGSVSDFSWDLFTKNMIESNIRDSLDCRPRFTFFISNYYTNPHKVQTLHFMGQELGLRTIDGEIQSTSSVQEWAQQVQAGYFWMERLVAGLTREDMRGFRAPNLQYTEKLFTALRRQNITYDSSFVPKEGRYWPFTLDAGAPNCISTEKCPLPTTGLWEFPLNYLIGDEYPDRIDARWAVDPTPGDGSAEAIRDMLALNFDQHYRGNRAPFSVNINVGWVVAGNVNKQNRVQGIIDFLKLASTHQDVVFASPKQVISWMQNPTTDWEELRRRPMFECPKFPWPVKRTERTCDGRDDDGNGEIDEHLMQSCRYTNPDLVFGTCKGCPRIYPNIEGPPVEDCQLDPDTVEWWCEKNGGYELGKTVFAEINGTFVNLPNEIRAELRALCTLDLDSCVFDDFDGVLGEETDDLGPAEAPSAESPSSDATADYPENDTFISLPLETTVANISAEINGTDWAISDVKFVTSEESSTIIVEVLERAAFNVTPYINPHTFEIILEGRFFQPRRGPTVRLSGTMNMTKEGIAFTSRGQFNYALFAPKLPTTDPSLSPKEPDDGIDDDDYDYDDDGSSAQPPQTEEPPKVPTAPPTKQSSNAKTTARASIGLLLLFLCHLV